MSTWFIVNKKKVNEKYVTNLLLRKLLKKILLIKNKIYNLISKIPNNPKL